MNYANYKEQIHSLIKQFSLELPGEVYHYKMAPGDRRLHFNGEETVKAAILILLFPGTRNIRTVLFRRNEYNGAHSGQVSFPGGKYEPEDENLEYTALRETAEEIGVVEKDIKIIGSLTPLFIPVSKISVHPFVGYMDYKPDFKPDPTEVSYLITTSLHNLSRPGNNRKEKWHLMKESYEVPFYAIENNKVWGATAMILSELLEVTGRAGLHPLYRQY